MKKTLLYSFAFLAAVSTTGCKGDYDDWASPQSYGQDADAGKYSATFANGEDASKPLSDKETIKLVKLTPSDPAIIGYTVKSLTVNGTDLTSAATANGTDIEVSTIELSKIVMKANNSRAAKDTPLEVETQVSLNLETGDAVNFETVGKTTANISLPALPAEDATGYFLLGDVTENGNGWDLKNPVWMTNNGDGTYSATVTTKKFNDKNYFKVYAGSTWTAEDAQNNKWDHVNAGQIGCETNGATDLEGFAVWNGDPVFTGGPQSPAIFSTGAYIVTFDAKNYKYSIKRAPAQYYVINGANRYVSGNKILDGRNLMLYTVGDNIYSLTTKWNSNNDIKLWDNLSLGMTSMFFGTTENNSKAESGDITQSSAGFIASPAAGYYRFTMDMNTMTYKWEAVDAPTTTYSKVTVSNINATMKHLAAAQHNWYAKDVEVTAKTTVHFTSNTGTVWGAAESGKTITKTKVSFGVGKNDITLEPGKYSFYLNDIDGTWNIIME
jgi:hypothetical protein